MMPAAAASTVSPRGAATRVAMADRAASPALRRPIIETVDQQAQHEIDAGLAGEEEKVDIVSSGGVQR